MSTWEGLMMVVAGFLFAAILDQFGFWDRLIK
jgi:hypothetical protein